MGVSNAFIKDILGVEGSGPDRPHLTTIVDSTSLIRSENKLKTAACVQLVVAVARRLELYGNLQVYHSRRWICQE